MQHIKLKLLCFCHVHTTLSLLRTATSHCGNRAPSSVLAYNLMHASHSKCLCRRLCLTSACSDEGSITTSTAAYFHAGMIVPELLEDGRVCVDMGEPLLEGSKVPTTLSPTQDGERVVSAPVDVEGSQWTVTAVGMGNPHAVVYERDGAPLVVRYPCAMHTNIQHAMLGMHAHLLMKAGPTICRGISAVSP